MSYDDTIYRLELDVSNVVALRGNFVYPSFPTEQSSLINCDLLVEQNCYPVDLSKELLQISKREFYLSGPVETDGIYGLFGLLPLWRQAATFSTDFGCNRSPPLESKSFWWDEVNSIKYFGTAGCLVTLNSLKDGSFAPYKLLKNFNVPFYIYTQELQFSLRVANLDSSDYNADLSGSVIYQSSPNPLQNPVVVPVSIFNLRWELSVAPSQGWKYPYWVYIGIVVVILLAIFVSRLVMKLVNVQETHFQLLSSILPAKVTYINHQSFDLVAIYASFILPLSPYHRPFNIWPRRKKHLRKAFNL